MKILKTYALLFLVSAVIVLGLGFTFLQPSIHEATYAELIDIHDIGEIRTESILNYIQENPNCTIDDLINVNGIGDKLLSRLKGKWD